MPLIRPLNYSQESKNPKIVTGLHHCKHVSGCVWVSMFVCVCVCVCVWVFVCGCVYVCLCVGVFGCLGVRCGSVWVCRLHTIRAKFYQVWYMLGHETFNDFCTVGSRHILPVKLTRKTYVGSQHTLTAVCWVATQFPKYLMDHDTAFRNPKKSSGPTDTLFVTGP